MTLPNTKKDGGPRESPTNVRNGKELINAAVDAFDNDRCKTALIQPQGQAFYLDCRNRAFSDVHPHLSVMNEGSGNAGRWLVRNLVKMNYIDSSVPPPQSTARCDIGPAVARTLKQRLSSERIALPCTGNTKLTYLMVFEGAAGRAIQRYHFVHTAGEAASTAFYHLANGYSMVFLGIILKESFHGVSGVRSAKSWETCKTIEELQAVSDSQPLNGNLIIRSHYEGKDNLGIIY